MADTLHDTATSARRVASQARIPTSKARTYLSQLCKHFAHKTTTELTATHGRVQFGERLFEGDASQPDLLVLSASAPDLDSLAAIEDVIDRHLRRFAYKEEFTLQWLRDPVRGA